jgi:hypothetical protein
MLKMRLVIASLGLAMIFPTIPTLQAQTAGVPAAPIPSQIFTAKRVFISNAGGDFDSNLWSGTQDRTYNEFYAAIRSWGRFELVAAPGDADLILQISFANPITEVDVQAGSGGSSNTPQFRLMLVDPKTHIVLWTLKENVSLKMAKQYEHPPMVRGRQEVLDKNQKELEGRNINFSDAINNLVVDLKTLTSQPAAPNAAR